ncbi:neprilysin-2-like [Venturia canescens]|uniref:neprilysin-2-like n=1 Tax=Venturia canescens TaxID=32260 RepID=UPI001C9BC419|nr:neprilysin-2-like [Venturia canescens]
MWQNNSRIQWNTTDFSRTVVSSYLFEFRTSRDITNITNWVYELEILDPQIPWSYLNDGTINKKVEAYRAYIFQILYYLDVDDVLEEAEIEDIFLFDLELAKIVFQKNENFDMNRHYTRMSVGQLEIKYPELHLKEMLNEDDDKIVQMSIDADVLLKLEEWKLKKSKRALANWVQWRCTVNKINELDSYVTHSTKMFLYTLYNGEIKKDKWRSCVQKVRETHPFLLDVLYYGQYLSDSLVKDTTEMFTNVRDQFIGFLEKAEWMGNGTKEQALEKIRKIKHNLGAHEMYMLDRKSNTSYEDFRFAYGLLAKNRANITKITMHLSESTNDSDESRPTDNFLLQDATYFELYLSMVFGATVYTDPYYNIDHPKALNYGALGYVLGHELAHSLDDHNRHVDINGNLNPWWDSQSNETFVERIKCLVERYKESGIEELGLDLNSFASRNDDIADHVGVTAAYFAYDKWRKENEPEKKLPGLDYSPRQLFWIAHANSHCSKYQRKLFRDLYLLAEHSPPKLRVNVPLSNMPEFSRDFKCSSYSKMNNVKKCSVW